MESSVPRGRQAGLTGSAKSLLRNHIRHVDTHNRLKEEEEMWKEHERLKGKVIRGHSASPGRSSSRQRRSDSVSRDRGDLAVEKSFLFDDRQEVGGGRFGSKRAHMDEGEDSGDRSTYWMRQLDKAEEGDPDRWGHSGFKELYPQDYASDRSLSPSPLKKPKKSSSGRGREVRKKKRKKRRYSDSSEDDNSDSDSERLSSKVKKSKKKKKKTLKHKKKKYRKRHDSSGSDAESESDDSGDERKSWRVGNGRDAKSGKSKSHSKKKKIR